MTRRRFVLSETTSERQYRSLLELMGRKGGTFLLVERSGLGLSPTAVGLLTALTAHLKSEDRQSEWPGTRLLGDSALVRRYALSPATAEVLALAVEGPFAWQQPALPEDLCVMRSDESEWLVTIAHESYAELVLSDSELVEIQAMVPGLGMKAAP